MKHAKIYQVIDDLQNISGSNDKKAYLEKLKDNEFWKKVIYYAYNPFYNYGLVNLDQDLFDEDNHDFEEGFNYNEGLFILLDKLRTRELSGNRAKEAVAEYISKVDYETAVVFELVLLRDFDIGCDIKTFNTVYGDSFIPTWSVMLADSGTISYPCFLEYKRDGVRFEAVVENQQCVFYTRRGNIMKAPILEEQILQLVGGEDCVLSCEVEGKDRKSVSGLVNKFLKNTAETPEDRNFIVHILDYLSLSEFKARKHTVPLEARIAMRNALFDDMRLPNIENVESFYCEKAEQMNEFYSRVIAEGGEGLIAKTPGSVYEHKRSTSWLKIKEAYEVELVVRGLTAGFGKRASLFGALECWSQDGLIKVDVGSGLTDKILDEIMQMDNPVGTIVKVRFNRLICDKHDGAVTMFLPRLIEVRLDKTVPNSTKEIIQEIVSNKGLVEADVLQRLNLEQWYRSII